MPPSRWLSTSCTTIHSTWRPTASSCASMPCVVIGRRVQWQHLQAAWHKAADGHPHLVLLSGEAGIGKTRLSEELEAWVSRQGMTTASARCYAAEGRLPYAPVTTWLRTEAIHAGLLTLDPVWLTEIARLLPELQAKRPDVPRPPELREGWQRQRFFEALARALLSAHQPLLLLLDDLQWCDHEQQGDILEMIGKHRETEQAYQQARNTVPAQEALTRARLCRKIAATRDYPPRLADADRAYREAEHLLEQAQHQVRQPWRDEWLHTHLGHLQVFFLLAQWQEMTRMIEQTQPLLEQYGTAAQRATFFMQVAMRDAVRDHYVVAPETLSTCQMGLDASLETGNPQLIGTTRFDLGYCFFLSGQFEQADEELRAALVAAEQVGDAELVARCRLHFLPLVWSCRGQVEAVRSVVAGAAAQGERRYASVITAQRAWVAWRDGKREEAESAGRAAVEEWQRQRPVYPFQWTGVWPLIGLAATSGQFALAVDYVRLLLAPTQQRPPETLLTVLEEAVHAWDAGYHERVRSLLQHAIPLAQSMGYL
jgi:tetratricopeptide (TPR) repeat protein